MNESVIRFDVERVDRGGRRATSDLLAVEEPLEIRVSWDENRLPATVSVTMRTPGDDVELAAGYLLTEGIIRRREDIAGLHPCRAGAIRVELAAGVALDLARLERHSYTSSSCGACGKTSTAALRATPSWPLPTTAAAVDLDLVRSLPQALREAQVLFSVTGGLHASALFDLAGRLLVMREDVGRHNALDKLIGAELLAGRLPAHERILIVSGRVSFELVQKALMAGIPTLAAIGAPSSLAVELAREAGMTLLGFVRADRVNVYSTCHWERIRHYARTDNLETVCLEAGPSVAGSTPIR
ncbi:MAG TPA: formate dehydrogenase accessory sulfurtransferase FdhD [Gemmatimonadaceae bacterium]